MASPAVALQFKAVSAEALAVFPCTLHANRAEAATALLSATTWDQLAVMHHACQLLALWAQLQTEEANPAELRSRPHALSCAAAVMRLLRLLIQAISTQPIQCAVEEGVQYASSCQFQLCQHVRATFTTVSDTLETILILKGVIDNPHTAVSTVPGLRQLLLSPHFMPAALLVLTSKAANWRQQVLGGATGFNFGSSESSGGGSSGRSASNSSSARSTARPSSSRGGTVRNSSSGSSGGCGDGTGRSSSSRLFELLGINSQVLQWAGPAEDWQRWMMPGPSSVMHWSIMCSVAGLFWWSKLQRMSGGSLLHISSSFVSC